MPLAPGSHLGPYEITAPLAAEGSGEAYRARDPKLDRWVVLKVLPPALTREPEHLARFEREARAVAALSHPNILAIYEFGREGDRVFTVTEFLEGESLRERLQGGALPARKAIRIALGMADGLAAAHAKGLIHRDLKPENVFLTRDGRVKVLDFGYIRPLPAWAHPGETASVLPTESVGLGPPADPGPEACYLAPEQVRGEPIDHRADVFAFGAILHEMLRGRRAFQRETGAQTFKAILLEEPAEGPGGGLPPVLERLIAHCLEKEPARRFQSMQDLAYGLSQLATTSAPPGAGGLGLRRWPLPRLLGVGALGGGLLLAGALARWGFGWGAPPPPVLPTFRRLNFVPGTLETARFGPEGRSIYFSQRIAGGRPELFVVRSGRTEPEALGIRDALLMDVSSTGELAFLSAPRHWVGGRYRGLLARVPGGGGAVRPVEEDVTEVVWDGEGLARILSHEDGITLEFPQGRRLLTSSHQTRTLCQMRLSREGTHLALVDSDARTRAEIVTYDREGHRRVLHTQEGDLNGTTLTGLAWGPGRELWVSELQGDQTALWAVDLEGRHRPLWRGQGHHQLMDVSARGEVLMAQHQARRGVLVQRAGEDHPRELSILGSTQAFGLSADGRTLLLLESPAMDGGTSRDEAYLRPVEGGPALRLGRGTPDALSADGKWVHMDTGMQKVKDLDPRWVAAYREAGLAQEALEDPKARARYALFVPTGLGQPRALPLPAGAVPTGYAFPLEDARRALACVSLEGKDHWVILEPHRTTPQVVTREGMADVWAGLTPLSPEGTRLLVSEGGRAWYVQPLPSGPPRPIPGVQPQERLVGWSADGKAVFARPELSVLPVTLTRIDLATGARRPVLAFAPPDAAGHVQTRGVFVSPEAKVFAFTYEKKLSDLYLVEGLR